MTEGIFKRFSNVYSPGSSRDSAVGSARSSWHIVNLGSLVLGAGLNYYPDIARKSLKFSSLLTGEFFGPSCTRVSSGYRSRLLFSRIFSIAPILAVVASISLSDSCAGLDSTSGRDGGIEPVLSAISGSDASRTSTSEMSDEERETERRASTFRDALSGTVCDDNIEVMIRGSSSQDLAGYDAKAEPQRHFGDKDMRRAYRYVEREQNIILNYVADADSSQDSRVRALYHFGKMVHTLHDFYDHSNYVAAMLEHRMSTDGGYGDPYSIGVFDWRKLSSGAAVHIGGKRLRILSDVSKRKDMLAEKIGDTTIGKVARGISIEETIRQWGVLEYMIRLKYGDKAVSILTALKKASCEMKEPPDDIPIEE